MESRMGMLGENAFPSVNLIRTFDNGPLTVVPSSSSTWRRTLGFPRQLHSLRCPDWFHYCPFYFIFSYIHFQDPFLLSAFLS